MPRLPHVRDGDTLKVKDAFVEFSFFPTAKTIRRAGIQSKAYTTDAWSIIHARVRRVRPLARRESAVAFAEQAHEFYNAALDLSTMRAKPLLLYYAFLNLTKSLCLCQGNQKVVGEAQHGLSEYSETGTSLKAAQVKGFPSTATTVNMFDEFLRAVNEDSLAATVTYRDHDLIGCTLIGHRLWCDATRRTDRFLRLTGVEILHNETIKKIWLRAGIKSGARSKANISATDISTKGFDNLWKQVQRPTSYDSDTLCWEQIDAVAYTGRPSDKL